MKDAYSFDLDERGRAAPPTTACSSPICAPSTRMGLKAIPMRADTGPIGGDLSHEFIILADTGESQVFCDQRLSWHCRCRAPTSISATMRPSPPSSTPVDHALCGDRGNARRDRLGAHCGEADRLSARGIEVGHIFYFGTKYSEPMGAKVTGPGRQGASRLTWAPTASARRAWSPRSSRPAHDDAGIIWPEAVAPFDVGLINMKPGDAAVRRGLRDDLRQL